MFDFPESTASLTLTESFMVHALHQVCDCYPSTGNGGLVLVNNLNRVVNLFLTSDIGEQNVRKQPPRATYRGLCRSLRFNLIACFIYTILYTRTTKKRKTARMPLSRLFASIGGIGRSQFHRCRCSFCRELRELPVRKNRAGAPLKPVRAPDRSEPAPGKHAAG